MVLVLGVHGISSISLLGAWICCHGYGGTVCCTGVCTGLDVEHFNWLLVAMASLLVVPLVVLVEMVQNW